MARTWLACDMDDGILRSAPAKRELLTWWRGLHEGSRVQVTRARAGVYEVHAVEDGEYTGQAWLMTATAAKRAGFDPTQAPLYPLADDPYERVGRAA
ncbi:MAG TPA: hypothetical protein VGS19_20360 [Streptosporangiaceae bacterium]|nr:hypothetical protein [Streptosporangiaceae bacterium]